MSKLAPASAVVAVFVLGLLALYRLLLLQYDSGDAYPPYSSFRADPLGTLVLHDALAASAAPAPRRNVEPLSKASFATDTTLLLAGAAVSKDEVATLQRIENYVAAGGHFVILFRPNQSGGVRFLESDAKRKAEEAAKAKKETPAEDADSSDSGAKKDRDDDPFDDRFARERDMMDALVPTADISERWGFGYDIRDFLEVAGKAQALRVDRAETAPASLPDDLPWHSDLIFTKLAPEWHVIYERVSHPVVIERAWGAGRIVLATDNYLVSNEAMLTDRAPAYLSWLAGAQRAVVFEETHLGVARAAGVMTLARRYGLFPLFGAGIVLALLFIWRNAASLVPKHPAARAQADVVAAQSTLEGIASLARRAIRPREVVESCWRLYQAPAMRQAPFNGARRAAVEAALKEFRDSPPRRRDPVQTYNRIRALIHERNPNP